MFDQSSPPIVSICIPTHNGGQWIEGCMRAAISQTYESFEILVIDDQSTDKTVEVARSLNDPRIRVIVNEARLGLSGNWNQCVRSAKGEFIKFLFQDDALYPECTQKMMAPFAADPDLGLTFARRDLVIENDAPADLAGEIPREYSDPHLRFAHLSDAQSSSSESRPSVVLFDGPRLFKQHLEKQLFQSCIAEPPSTLIRKEVFRRLGLFNTRMHQACDIEMWLRIMFFFKVGFVDEKLLMFRVHGKSTTASNRASRRAEYDRFWMLEGLLGYPEIRLAHPEIVSWRDDLRKRYRRSLIRPTAGWRSLKGKDGFREAVSDAREMPRRIKFLKEANTFEKERAPLHPRLEPV